MSDLSIALESAIRSAAVHDPAREPDLTAEFLGIVDPEGKILSALETLGPVVGRDVVVLDAGSGFRACQLHQAGARVTALRTNGDFPSRAASAGCLDGDLQFVAGTFEATGLPEQSADAVVSYWSAFRGPDGAQLAEAERILRPGGRLLVVHDYGRDDVCDLWRDEFVQQVEWSRRNGPFLGGGFRVRVVHCRWTFDSLEHAATLLTAAFGAAGSDLAGSMKRPRLEYNVAIYHRTREVEPVNLTVAGSRAQ